MAWTRYVIWTLQYLTFCDTSLQHLRDNVSVGVSNGKNDSSLDIMIMQSITPYKPNYSWEALKASIA